MKNEWIEVNIPFGPISKLDEMTSRERKEILESWDYENKVHGPYSDPIFQEDTFCFRQLAQPGTLIELESGDKYLIGDINECGGTCGCCDTVGAKTIVKRYKVVWEKEREN